MLNLSCASFINSKISDIDFDVIQENQSEKSEINISQIEKELNELNKHFDFSNKYTQ